MFTQAVQNPGFLQKQQTQSKRFERLVTGQSFSTRQAAIIVNGVMHARYRSTVTIELSAGMVIKPREFAELIAKSDVELLPVDERIARKLNAFPPSFVIQIADTMVNRLSRTVSFGLN